MSSKLLESPEILFKAISRLNLLPFDDVKCIVKRNIQGNAYCLLPENFIYAMVKSSDVSVRNNALHTILSNRNVQCQSQKQIPTVRWNAEKWTDLIDLHELLFCEPPSTACLSVDDIQSFINTASKPNIPDFPSHSQNVERSVKLVSEAAHTVYGDDNRHRSIVTKLMSRKHRPVFHCKAQYSQSYDDICS